VNKTNTAKGPLSDIVVLDAATVIAAPLAACLLGDAGARVIKIEHPTTGDTGRRLSEGRGLYWKFIARNKESVTCNLSSPEGAELFRQLAKKADVVIENFRPGTMAKWGLSYEELSRDNPRLIMAHISGFGQDGPFVKRPGYGSLAEARGGIAFVTGEEDGPPLLPGAPVADPLAGLTAVSAITMALWARDAGGRNGRGEEIDISLYGPMLYLMGGAITDYSGSGHFPTRGSHLGRRVIRYAGQCRDESWVAVAAIGVKLLQKTMDFARSTGHLNLAETDVEKIDLVHVDAALRAWMSERDRPEVLAALTQADIPNGPINSVPEILEDELYRARGDFITFDDPQFGPLEMPRAPFRFREMGYRADFAGHDLGADNARVYSEMLGLDEAALAALRAQGTI
jgi:formyl-CoA transferase